MQDKRQHRRVILDIDVLCRPETGESFTACAKDVSLGGMFVGSTVKPEIGTAMTLETKLPGQEKSQVFPAFVRWINAEGFGVQFGLLGAKATHAITRVIR